MANEALYQKYRSKTFDEVVGQHYVVQSLKNALKSGRVGHAYLFCGPRGTGKTTMARLLAKAVNCENPAEAPCGHCASCRAVSDGSHQDVIEINAANETHVENIRDLIDRAQLAPMMSRYKIYIIDEVHQLSNAAASALLKTLEEPPAHVIFILATTDPQKLLPTIISRCQRFDFAKVPAPMIRAHLMKIAASEGFSLEERAAERIASLADGGMRDALSMLEQAMSFADGTVREEDVDEIYGLVSPEELTAFLTDTAQGDLAAVLGRIERYEERGTDLRRFTEDLMTALKDTVIMAYTGKEELLRKLSGDQAKELAEICSPGNALAMIEVFLNAAAQYRTARSVRDVLEVACMRAAPEKKYVPVQQEKPQKQAEPVYKNTDTIEPVPAVETEPAPAPEPEPAPAEETPAALDAEQVLSLLLQCSKEYKAQDSEKLALLIGPTPDNRFAAMLQQCSLLASGADCLILGCDEQGIADTINDPQENRALYFWLQEHGLDRMPYAAVNSVYSAAVQQFIERRRTGTLPEAAVITRYIKEEETAAEKDPLEVLQNLFGDSGILEVIET